MSEEMKDSGRVLYFGYNSDKIVTALYDNDTLAGYALPSDIVVKSTRDPKVIGFLEKARDYGETVFVMESLCCLCKFPITSLDNIVYYRTYDKYEEGNMTSLLNIAATTITEDLKKLAANSEIPIITAKQNPETVFWAIYNVHSGEIVSVEDKYPGVSDVHHIKTNSMMYSREDYAIINIINTYSSKDKIIEDVYNGILSVSVDDEGSRKLLINPDGKHTDEGPAKPRTRYLIINKFRKRNKVVATFGTIPRFTTTEIKTTFGDYDKKTYKCIKVTETGDDDYITNNINNGNINPDMFMDISSVYVKGVSKK